MAIGFMSFGGMLTGGDETKEEKPKVEAEGYYRRRYLKKKLNVIVAK